jgi:sugar phosphate permease
MAVPVPSAATAKAAAEVVRPKLKAAQASVATATMATHRPWSQWAASKSGVFLLTFFSYVLFHASRKSFSAIKGEMSSEQWIHSRVYPRDQQAQMYGLLDTLFMGFYALGLYVRCVIACLVRTPTDRLTD